MLSCNFKAITIIRSMIVADVEVGGQETMMQVVGAADSNSDINAANTV